MKVLLQNRNSYLNSIAGDGIQILKTQEYLRKLQVEAEITSDPEADLAKYDLVHLFNLMPVEEIWPLFHNAFRQKKKIVLSPIFWNPNEFLSQSDGTAGLKSWWETSMELRQKLLLGVDLMLPNSLLELAVLKKHFQRLPAAQIVVNGVDRLFCHAKPDQFRRKYHGRDFILSVGRICRRKNQLALIKAARALKLPLVLIGPLNDGLYYQECRRASAGADVKFFDCLSQPELSSAYAAARVHALVSWYDTPGLVSLEAALACCAIVTTIRGSAKEYFGNLAYYCNPNSSESIQRALRNAWVAPENLQLKTQVFKNYIWEKTAEQTLRGYRTVLSVP
ncbi:MAG TPA: glycosyltransferase [Firmicutes bacterium]|nr:glycosyltransferase [Bacillota bacterium]